MNVRTIAGPLAFFALAACASQSPDAPATTTSSATTGSLGAASATTPALDVLRQGGSFLFSLDESTPASRMREHCASQSGGDAAKADACYADVRFHASHEGIRFSFDAEKHLVWTSFGIEDGKEAIYIVAPLAITTEGDRFVIATLAGTARGLQVDGRPQTVGKQFRFDVEDATTVVMNDPNKGRLVFHRAQ